MRVLLLAVAASLLACSHGYLGARTGVAARRRGAVQMAGFGGGQKSSRIKGGVLKEPCKCGSGKAYKDCCKVLHDQGNAQDVQALIRARFAAYCLRLPDFLMESTVKSYEQRRGAVKNLDTKAKTKREANEERKELLSYMDSYDFDKLVIGDVEAVDEKTARCSFSCEFTSRVLQAGLDSEFLETSVVGFKETSTFKFLGGAWRYLDGEVEYEGTTLEDKFGKKYDDLGDKQKKEKGAEVAS